MAVEIAPVLPLNPAELEDRRLVAEITIGTMRIEGLEPDETTKLILYRYKKGRISLDEMSRLLHDYSATML